MSKDAQAGGVREIDVTKAAAPFFFLKVVCAIVVTTAAVMSAQFVALAVQGVFHEPGALPIYMLLFAVIGWAAWLVWKNLGVIEIVTQKWMNSAFLLMALVCGAAAAAVLATMTAYPMGAGDEATLNAMGFAGLAYLAVLGLVGAWSLASARGAKLTGLGIKLRDFMRELKVHENRGATRVRAPARRPVLGALLGIAGFGWLVGFSFVPDAAYAAGYARVADQVNAVGILGLIYARVMYLPSAAKLLASDKRAPVLFLRSFTDEEKGDYLRANFGLFDFSLESRLADHFSMFGPFIAIGSPKDKIPRLGAVRARLSDDEWQATVLDWMDRAQRILALAGTTHWIGWELKTVVERGHAQKLIVQFPQLKKKRKQAAAARLESLQAAFAGTPWAPALAQLDKAEHIRAISFGANGAIHVARSRSRNRNAYHIAALAAHLMQLREPAPA